MMYWVMAATLVCSATVLTSCVSNDDNSVVNPDGLNSMVTINITEDDLTDGTYYYKLFVTDKTMDYSSVEGEDGLSYGADTDEWIVCVPTNYLLGYAAKIILEQVTAVPKNTPVLIRAKKPQAYIAVADGTAITFKRVNKVPAGTGVLLCAKGGAKKDVSVVVDEIDDVSGNVLRVATSDMDAAALQAAGAYILGYENGAAGFYKADANASLKAGQCYLTSEGANNGKVVLF